MSAATVLDNDPGDYIDEDPMEKPEFERALFKHLSRSERRRFWRALDEAGLIVFRE